VGKEILSLVLRKGLPPFGFPFSSVFTCNKNYRTDTGILSEESNLITNQKCT
jgi:hypothetical protein